MPTAQETNSIAEQLAFAKEQLKDSDSAATDSRLLMCQVLECNTVYLMTWPEKLLDADQLCAFQHLIEKRKQGHPVAYLLGYRYFWNLRLDVSPATLIPRPETELLVETVLDLALHSKASVLDLGTGTGAIALALASEKPDWQITGIDKNEEAVTLAKQNGQSNKLQQVCFKQSDWFSDVSDVKFDLIVSNPPYVEQYSEYLQLGDVRFEPASALTSGEDGLNDIRHIIPRAVKYLAPKAWLVFEHGHLQAQGVQSLLRENGFEQLRSVSDLNGHPRVTLGCYNA
jgi:release factor glutamine methyltransferase